MKHKEKHLAEEIAERLTSFSSEKRYLAGIASTQNKIAFIEQLIESIRRIRFLSVIREREISFERKNPSSDLFDPLRAAILHHCEEDTEEAFWLVFLAVHFGKHRKSGWRLARDVYGALGSKTLWSWRIVIKDPRAFSRWIGSHAVTLQGGDGVVRHFGNHRKYESLKDSSSRSTGKVVESYIAWVLKFGSHKNAIQAALKEANGKPELAFDVLYRSMNTVVSFGRTARFDYLTMVGKIGLAKIEPGSTYMQGATGPLKGARLLFGKPKAHAILLDEWLLELGKHLKLYFGMQVLEDALCNWQKSPRFFRPFRG